MDLDYIREKYLLISLIKKQMGFAIKCLNNIFKTMESKNVITQRT